MSPKWKYSSTIGNYRLFVSLVILLYPTAFALLKTELQPQALSSQRSLSATDWRVAEFAALTCFQWTRLFCEPTDFVPFSQSQKKWLLSFCQPFRQGQGWVPTSPAVALLPLNDCWLFGRRWVPEDNIKKLLLVLMTRVESGRFSVVEL